MKSDLKQMGVRRSKSKAQNREDWASIAREAKAILKEEVRLVVHLRGRGCALASLYLPT